MAKRVNKRFILWFSAIAIGVVGGGYVLRKVLIKPHPEQFKALAVAADKAGHFAGALDNWKKALQIAPRDPESLTGFGESLHHMGEAEDPTIIQQGLDRREWQAALEVNPNYTRAVIDLRDYWEEQVQHSPGVETATEARKWSGEALRLAPDDPRAAQWEAFKDSIIIEGWIKGQETDEALVLDTEKSARALMAKHPELPLLPLALAQLEIRRGSILIGQVVGGGQPDAVTALFKQAADEVESAVKRQPDNAMMHFDASEIY